MLNQKRIQKIEAILTRKQPMLQLFLDNVASTQNISAIIRSADAVGVINLYYSNKQNMDVKIHKTITQGTHRWLEMIRIDSDKKVDFFKEKQAAGFQVLVTHFGESAMAYRQVDYNKTTIIVMGNEKEGVSSEVLHLADQQIVIPMQGMAQSLNVSVATALILFEAQAQLEKCGLYDKAQLRLEKREHLKEQWIYRDVIARRSKGRVKE